ncbi:MAG TPA: PepSY domain-containing protein [Thermoanaerobaculia bacterium]|nr:PepSY domain-containing protein [Thermoanaerobaculia bacterium]
MPRRLAARWLVACHRWLGIGMGALFVLWFASGLVLMWRGMPELDEARRLARLPPLDLASARVDPAAAAATAGIEPEALTVGMLGARPVYRLRARGRVTTVYADSGETFAGFDPDSALARVRALRPDVAATLRYDRRLDRPDQWTLQSRALLPMHRVELGDGDGAVAYLSDRTGELALETSRASRLWGRAGAVVHWMYFTPLRRHGSVWLQTMIWLSVAGLALCLSGLGWGAWAWLRRRRSPYTGWLRWHHLAGLLFGVLTLTWTLSGLLSLDPWSWHPGTGPTPFQVATVRGGPLGPGGFGVERLRDGLRALRSSLEVRELELGRFRGEPFLLTRAAEDPRRRFVAWLGAADARASGPDRRELVAAAEAAMPGWRAVAADRLERYDAYYYHRAGTRPLPVLRVRFDDPAATALYLDALTGAPVHREQRLTRWNRWLYHGLHSWDHPALLQRPWLREPLMVLGLLGGLVASAAAAAPGCRRLARALRRPASKTPGRE